MWEDLGAAGMLKEAWEPPPAAGDELPPGDANAGQPFSKPKRETEMVGDRVRPVLNTDKTLCV